MADERVEGRLDLAPPIPCPGAPMRPLRAAIPIEMTPPLWSGRGGPDVSLLERCPRFRGWYVQTSMELGPEDVSLLERCPHRMLYDKVLFTCYNKHMLFSEDM